VPELTKSVGDGGANLKHDVALVRAMLLLVKDAKGAPYLAGPYDGTYSDAVKGAIAAFQRDWKLSPAAPLPAAGIGAGKAGPGNFKVAGPLGAGGAQVVVLPAVGAGAAKAAPVAPAPGPGQEVSGVMAPGGPTLRKLAALLPATHAELRVIAGHSTVYLAADAKAAAESEAAIAKDAEFEPQFRAKIATLVREMHGRHKIALSLTPTGRRRNFAQQQKEVNTKAGPGESNHNFGRAADIGFRGFRWLQGDGKIKQDVDWLNALQKTKAASASAFWDARDAIAKTLNLFRLQFERVHLQAFDQAKVSNARSLVKLLNAVGTMKWEPRYKSDLGFGGKLFAVGTARQIYAGNATVTDAEIAAAKSAALGKAVAPADIKAADVQAMKDALKADFDRADQNWAKWAPVP
jgi:hypothetical protein